jgi:hypothetical protein
MSLTLARLCGEWQLISKNYRARKLKSRGRNWKAVEKIRKPLKKIFLDFLEIGKPLKKTEF